MELELIDVLSTVAPAETHFITEKNYYVGTLSYWLIAKVESDDGSQWIDSFPIHNNRLLLHEKIQYARDLSVWHWSVFRSELGRLNYSSDDRVLVEDLLDKLWGETQ